MSLDEIESRLGSLLQANTISQLKSGVWKERLEDSMSETFSILWRSHKRDKRDWERFPSFS
ncbi:hypothetical protein GIB67_011628 [Kingdonia uniflora]|uniref:Uncharacterized protein n=1 Tax=Kingdonia uniflora TaxID=39325 RepID=A0A7J7NMC2_9MAGN|nr:hypothetical protein GIB67_011628 [Kingdonia uniflora]